MSDSEQVAFPISYRLPWPTECQLLGDLCFHQHWTPASSECVKEKTKKEHPLGSIRELVLSKETIITKTLKKKRFGGEQQENTGAYY